MPEAKTYILKFNVNNPCDSTELAEVLKSMGLCLKTNLVLSPVLWRLDQRLDTIGWLTHSPPQADLPPVAC